MSVQQEKLLENIDLSLRLAANEDIEKAKDSIRSYRFYDAACYIDDALNRFKAIKKLDNGDLNKIFECYNDLALCWLNNDDVESVVTVWWQAIHHAKILLDEYKSADAEINLFIAKAYSNLAYEYLSWNGGYRYEMLGSLVNAVLICEQYDHIPLKQILSYYEEIVKNFIILNSDFHILYYSERFLKTYYESECEKNDLTEVTDLFFANFAEVIETFVKDFARKEKISLLIRQYPKIIEELYTLQKYKAAKECCFLIISANDTEQSNLDCAKKYLDMIYNVTTNVYAESLSYPVNTPFVIFNTATNIPVLSAKISQEVLHDATSGIASNSQYLPK